MDCSRQVAFRCRAGSKWHSVQLRRDDRRAPMRHGHACCGCSEESDPTGWDRKAEKLFQSGYELAPEDATQRGDGQEESSRGGDPSGTVGCKTASRNHVMYVRMMVKVLSPSVEHAKEPDVGTQMFRVVGEFEQRRGTSSEKQIVKQSLVLQG